MTPRFVFPSLVPAVLAILTFITPALGAQGGKEIYSFDGHNAGYVPLSPPILDSVGNLYGTTEDGGTGSLGTVYELVRNSNGTYTEKVLHSFQGAPDGANPVASPIFDHAGNLYGTAGGGNRSSFGVVYELSPGSNGEWTEQVLYTFTGGADGEYPDGGLVMDNSGNLYGTTVSGGNTNCQYGCGTVYELSPNGGGQWTKTILYSFTGGDDGATPTYGNLVLDAAGNLYGTASAGGSGNSGTVFKLTKGSGGQWTQSVLYAFTGGNDGASPQFGLTFDPSGNLYGSTNLGGAIKEGTIFELSPQANGYWSENTLLTFDRQNGEQPSTPVTFDGKGRLYGTAEFGGESDGDGGGTIFRLTPVGGTWSHIVLYRFPPNNGVQHWYPFGGLTYDPVRNQFFGTTEGGGADRAGDVFEFIAAQ